MDQDTLLKKWLNNELSESEKEHFSKQDDFIFNQKIIDSAKLFKASNHIKIKDFEAFKKEYQNQKTTKRNIDWYKPFLRIAAILVIALGVYFSVFYNSTTSINTQIGEKTTIELPDHSEVILNALTTISFKGKKLVRKQSLKFKRGSLF